MYFYRLQHGPSVFVGSVSPNTLQEAARALFALERFASFAADAAPLVATLPEGNAFSGRIKTNALDVRLFNGIENTNDEAAQIWRMLMTEKVPAAIVRGPQGSPWVVTPEGESDWALECFSDPRSARSFCTRNALTLQAA